MDLSLLRKIGFIMHKDDGKVDVSVCSHPLTNQEITELIEKSKAIFELRPAFTTFIALELNYHEISTIPSKPETLDTQLTYIEGLNVISIATQKILNFLAAASSYLTITEQKINYVYGRASTELKNWNKKRKDLHSENFSYRFAYELRNYSQHYGLPLSSLQLNQTNLLSTTPTKEIKLIIKIGNILNSAYKWGSIKREIEQQTCPIDVIVLCDHYMRHLRELHHELFLTIDRQLEDADDFLTALFKNYKIPTGAHPIIFVYEKGEDEYLLSQQQEHFPNVEIKHLRNQKLKNENFLLNNKLKL